MAKFIDKKKPSVKRSKADICKEYPFIKECRPKEAKGS